MLRAPKFRVWDKEKKRVYYPDNESTIHLDNDEGELVLLFGGEPVISDHCGRLLRTGYRFFVNIDTGLTDKDGKAIYTDDVLEDENGKRGMVSFFDGAYQLLTKDDEKALGWFKGKVDPRDLRVVTNTLETPDWIDEDFE